ncbi:DUF2141 domain-containing protein [Algoriphagus boritolerans]|uniref:DUF2141 domain-containing protein n=1 Tax=Algoriphagus boritolerans TaxID=308111 RepID=UPI002FCE3021
MFFSAQQNTSVLDLQISGAKSDKGVVRILVFDSENGYPDQLELAVKSLTIPIVKQKCTVKINDLKPGNYAISVIHDEDSNGALNTNPFGYPLEKYGFSNNAKAYFSAPPFSKAAFELKSEVKTIQIQLR